jgi:SET domain
MAKGRNKKKTFSLAPVQFRQSAIEGRGVFARRRFEPGDVIVAYAPKQQRLGVEDPAAVAAADTKFTLLSDQCWVIVPDTSVPGGWLCNHSCNPNAAIFSSGEGRIQCMRPILPGQEVTIFYGWVTRNHPERDRCRCGSARCRGFINFDVSNADAEHFELDTQHGRGFRQRLEQYAEYLRTIDQEQVLDAIAQTIAEMAPRA